MMMMHEDIVCGRPVDASTAVWTSRYHGEPYSFCSLECRERFELGPEDYLVVAEHGPVHAAALLSLLR